MHMKMTETHAIYDFIASSYITALQLYGETLSCIFSLRKSFPPLVLPKQERAGAGFYFIMLNLPAFKCIEIETVVGG